MRYLTQTTRSIQWLALCGSTALLTAATTVPFMTYYSYAQSAPTTSSSLPDLTQWQQAGFTPKVNTSADRTTIGGTRSGPTNEQEPILLALVPDHNLYGVTVRPDPSVLVYLTEGAADRIIILDIEAVYPSTAEQTALQDRLVYTQEWAISHQAGLMNLQLPATLPDPVQEQTLLEANQDYRWTVSVIDGVTNVELGSTSGYISYVPQEEVKWTETQAVDQIAALSSYEQGTYLFENYVWYDGVAALAQAYQDDPAAVAEDWQRALEISGLTPTQVEQLEMQMRQNRQFLEGEVLP